MNNYYSLELGFRFIVLCGVTCFVFQCLDDPGCNLDFRLLKESN